MLFKSIKNIQLKLVDACFEPWVKRPQLMFWGTNTISTPYIVFVFFELLFVDQDILSKHHVNTSLWKKYIIIIEEIVLFNPFVDLIQTNMSIYTSCYYNKA